MKNKLCVSVPEKCSNLRYEGFPKSLCICTDFREHLLWDMKDIVSVHLFTCLSFYWLKNVNQMPAVPWCGPETNKLELAYLAACSEEHSTQRDSVWILWSLSVALPWAAVEVCTCWGSCQFSVTITEYPRQLINKGQKPFILSQSLDGYSAQSMSLIGSCL